jgi:methionine-rich copper-binding protein CopC
MQIHRSIGGAPAAALLLLLGNAAASAHAELRRAAPAAGGTVPTAPPEVLVNFSEPLEAAFSSIVVRDSVGKRVDKADAHLDPSDPTTMRVSLPPLAQGTYIVVWRALTADTHRTEGAFIFRVGE